MGLDFDDESYSSVAQKAPLTRALDVVPVSTSLKMYCPYPKDQGDHGTCVAWASGYCGRTIVEAIKNGWKNRDDITRKAYSSSFLFRLLRPDDTNCDGGSNIAIAFQLLKDKGDMIFSDLPPLCVPGLSQVQMEKASSSRIKDYQRLFEPTANSQFKIQAVKKSIAENKPVVFGMMCPNSFFKAKGVWAPSEMPDASMGGHAMCVVGYDDNKYGGAFEIQNSWGTDWGNEGYIWIKYDDYARFTKYAFEFVDLPEPKPNKPDLSGQLKLVLSTGEEMAANLLLSTRGLIVVEENNNKGPLTTYQTKKAYTFGTRFRIYISNNQPAYVYAISSDLSNAVTKIFPYKDGISAALTDKRNDVAIPDENHFVQFDNQPGTDFLCILYSKKALDINKVVSDIKSQQGSFNEKVFKALEKDLVDPKQITFSKEKISFQGSSFGKSVIALMIEMEHK